MSVTCECRYLVMCCCIINVEISIASRIITLQHRCYLLACLWSFALHVSIKLADLAPAKFCKITLFFVCVTVPLTVVWLAHGHGQLEAGPGRRGHTLTRDIIITIRGLREDNTHLTCCQHCPLNKTHHRDKLALYCFNEVSQICFPGTVASTLSLSEV